MRPTSHTESWNSPVSLQLYYPYFLSFFSSLAYMGCLCSHWSSTLLTWLFHSSKMTSTSIKWSIVFAFLSAKRNVTELLGLLKGALHNLRKIIVFNGSQGCGGNCSQDSVACTCTQLTFIGQNSDTLHYWMYLFSASIDLTQYLLFSIIAPMWFRVAKSCRSCICCPVCDFCQTLGKMWLRVTISLTAECQNFAELILVKESVSWLIHGRHSQANQWHAVCWHHIRVDASRKEVSNWKASMHVG